LLSCHKTAEFNEELIAKPACYGWFFSLRPTFFREETMLIQNLFSNVKWNKGNFRIQLARMMQFFFILIFLTSAVGVNPVAAQDIPNGQLASPSASDNFNMQKSPALSPRQITSTSWHK
jgi:hypothetical protein